MKEDSIEEDIKNAEHFIDSIKTDKEYKEENGWHGYYNKEIVELTRILEHILSDYKRVLKENEKLKNRWDKDTHILQNDLDIANAKNIEKDKIIDLMSEQLTTPIHDKKWIKKYYENKVNGGNER